MRRFMFFLTVLALVALIGCDKIKNPTPPTSSEVTPKSLLQSDPKLAEAQAQLEKDTARLLKKAEELKAQGPPPSHALAKTTGNTLTVPDEYSNIAAALAAASPGDKILVKQNWSEYVDVSYISNIRITAAPGVSLYPGSFYIYSSSGIQIDNWDNIGGDWTGVAVVYSTDIIIKDNKLSGSSLGAYLYSSSNCLVKHNDLSASGHNGIVSGYGGGNTFDENTATGGIGKQGIYTYETSGNEISGNTFSSRYAGIYLYNSDNNALKNNHCNFNYYYGIMMDYGSDGNIVGSDNTANNNGIYGIELWYGTSGNTVKKNTAINNGSCDIVNFGTGNKFIKNTANCTIGVL